MTVLYSLRCIMENLQSLSGFLELNIQWQAGHGIVLHWQRKHSLLNFVAKFVSLSIALLSARVTQTWEFKWIHFDCSFRQVIQLCSLLLSHCQLCEVLATLSDAGRKPSISDYTHWPNRQVSVTGN